MSSMQWLFHIDYFLTFHSVTITNVRHMYFKYCLPTTLYFYHITIERERVLLCHCIYS